MTASLALPEHTHVWMVFEGGRGCESCAAWVHDRPFATLIDPLPTSAILRPVLPAPAYGSRVDEVIEVMNDLLEIARPDVTFGELEQVAIRIIGRIQAAA